MKRVYVLLLVFSFSLYTSGQTGSERIAGDTLVSTGDSSGNKKDCVQKDVFDYILKKWGDRIAKSKRFSFIGLPYVAYSPVTELQIGLGGTLSWHLGDPATTNLSAANVSAYVTTRKQLVIQIKSNTYTNENKWFLQGDWRFYIYPFSTFSLGTMSGYGVPPVPDIQPETDACETTVYPMDFKWLKVHQVFSRKISRNLYTGLGYHFDYHFDIQDLSLKLDTPDVIVTPHYAYSELHGFETDRYATSGISFNCVYDSRDNIINAYKGIFANVSYRYNLEWLGSTRSSSRLWTEFRAYISLSKRLPRHVIAFWTYGSFDISGDVPFLDLPSTGFDQMNSSGRGYLQGRWRGENLIYAEAEYRFPITPCSQLLGGVFFVNATTASSKDLGFSLFEAIKPAAGFGLRIMITKKTRLNLAIDIGWGVKSHGFYVVAQEAF